MIKSLFCIYLLAISLAIPSAASALELREFATPGQKSDFDALIAELRCLVCQNQNLADSDAELAKDLRDEIHELLDEGKTQSQVIDFMVERYGDFVRYRPPLKPTTAALWFGPFILIAICLWMLARQIRARRALATTEPLNDAERHRLDTLLKDRTDA